MKRRWYLYSLAGVILLIASCAGLWGSANAPFTSSLVASSSAPLPPPSGSGPAPTLAAALTVNANVGWGSVTRQVLVLTAGAPPTGGSLAAASGTRPVAVQVDPDGPACASAPRLYTGLGNERWCLVLYNIAPGQSFVGALKGTATTLTLTAQARALWVYPFLVGLAGLLIAALVVWVVTKRLPAYMTENRLARALRSAQAGAEQSPGAKGWRRDGGSRLSGGRVEGIYEWAQLAKGRLSDADRLARVNWLNTQAVDQTMAARAQLKKELDDPTGALPDCPLRDQARTEAGLTEVKAEDLLNPDGTRATSPAELLGQLVKQAKTARAAFEHIAGALIATMPPGSTGEAEILRRAGVGAGNEFLSQFTMDTYLATLRSVLAKLQVLASEARAKELASKGRPQGDEGDNDNGNALGRAVLDRTRAEASAAVAASPALLPSRPEPVAVTERLSAAETYGLVALVGAVLGAIAVGTVLVTQYFPNQTFGTARDYLELFISALGSSSVAAIVAVVLPLQGPAPWFGAKSA